MIVRKKCFAYPEMDIVRFQSMDVIMQSLGDGCPEDGCPEDDDYCYCGNFSCDGDGYCGCTAELFI